MTRSTSAVAVCCSSASLNSGRAAEFLEEPGIGDGDGGLTRERLEQADLDPRRTGDLALNIESAPMTSCPGRVGRRPWPATRSWTRVEGPLDSEIRGRTASMSGTCDRLPIKASPDLAWSPDDQRSRLPR